MDFQLLGTCVFAFWGHAFSHFGDTRFGILGTRVLGVLGTRVSGFWGHGFGQFGSMDSRIANGACMPKFSKSLGGVRS